MRHRRRPELARLVQHEDDAPVRLIRHGRAGHRVEGAVELERRDEHPARLGEKALGVLGALPFAEYRREQQRGQGAHAAEQLRFEQVLVA